MENGTNSFAVSLRPPTVNKDDGADDLTTKIRLINAQRDGFRNVTEEQLQLEMNEMKNGDTSESEDEDESESDKKRGTMEILAPKRPQMQNALFNARSNGLFALDALSLTASGFMKSSFATASPILQETVPAESFKFTRRQPAPPSSNVERERKKNQLWTGSFMSNNTDAADTLLAAATRLEGLVKAETEYWGQLLSLTSKGWPVYKPAPRDAMHVRFVASEAAPYFRMQGVARLTPDKDGTIKLGSRVGAEPRTLRLRLARNDEVAASSVTASLLSLADLGSSLEDKVRREQSSLFEEELFQEMTIESRTLQPLGVKLRENVLHIPTATATDGNVQEEYLVDLIPIDDASELISTISGTDKDLLDAQSILLRLLLSHVYHLRLKDRTKAPPPISEKAHKAVPSNIVRSFMAITQHQNLCEPLLAFLAGLSRVMASAGLPYLCDALQVPSLHEIIAGPSDNDPRGKAGRTVHELFARGTAPQKTTIHMKLTQNSSNGSSSEHTVKIHALTNLSPPVFGTEFVIELPPAIAKIRYGPDADSKRVVFSGLSDVKEYLIHLLSLQTTLQVIAPKYAVGWTTNNDTPILSKTVGKNGTHQKVAIGIRINDKQAELHRRYMGGPRRDHDQEMWLEATNPKNAGKKGLAAVFVQWAKEIQTES